MRRSPGIAEQDQQAADLEQGAAEMRALAEQLRHAPVTLAELHSEGFGDNITELARQLGDDVYLDDIGRRVVTRQRARTLLEERAALEERKRLYRERSDAALRAAGAANDRERRAMLAAVDARQAKYGADMYATAAEVALAEVLADKHREAGERWADYTGIGR